LIVTAALATWGGLPLGATVVVDTAPFVYLLDGHPDFASKFEGLFEAAQAGGLHIALSSITLAEVLTGPLKAGHSALANRYEKALLQYKVIPVSAGVAVLAAQLRARYKLKLPDAIRLATALDVEAAAFVTHDRDFSHVVGIRVLMGEVEVV
jgi:predicted nucleic acid-binding protein